MSAAHRFAAELSAATDELNEAFTRAERALVGLGIGVPGEVALPKGGVSGVLRFTKWGGAWCLVIIGTTDSPKHETPIRSAPRNVRIAAASVLADLVSVLRGTVERELAIVRSATATVSDFAARLEEETRR